MVGFDSALTAGNNKAVLDAIAAAGGTGVAHVASNQAQLTSTLNTIAVNTATCCKDVCATGASICSGTGARQTCQMDAAIGCTTWVTQQCASGSSCANGTCSQCSNTCSAGATRCANGNAEQCVANAQGCTSWQPAQTCGYGEVCSNGSCNTCQACTMGASRCTATGVETCEWSVLSGCTQWTARACAAGSTCTNGSCATCNATCTAGAKRCANKTVETCVADASGCTVLLAQRFAPAVQVALQVAQLPLVQVLPAAQARAVHWVQPESTLHSQVSTPVAVQREAPMVQAWQVLHEPLLHTSP